jgi:putative transposase
MSHSLNKIWVHVVIRTKNRAEIIKGELEENLYRFLNKQLIELGCFVKAINGVPDHIHLLFLLSPKRSVSEVMKQIKGSSSHWINSEKLTKEKFEWKPVMPLFQ